MNFSWVYFFYQLDYKLLRDRDSILFTSAPISNPILNSHLSLHTVNDQKKSLEIWFVADACNQHVWNMFGVQVTIPDTWEPTN